MNILLVEDDRRIAAVISQALIEEGHHVNTLATGRHAEEHILTMPYNVAVLDLMLPECDGFQVLRKVREARSTMPILVLSARDGMADVVRALDLGADDYVTKPFHLDLLLARVRSVSRRGPIAEPARLSVAGLVLDPGRRELTRAGEIIPLTRREFADAFAAAFGLPHLRVVPPTLARLITGKTATTAGRSQRVRNDRFKQATGWAPRYASARDGWAAAAAARVEEAANA